MKSIDKVQIVGDDIYATNLERLKKGFLNISSNAILIKPNQIGTVSETIDVIKFALKCTIVNQEKRFQYASTFLIEKS